MKQGKTYSNYDEYIKHQASKARSKKIRDELKNAREYRVKWFKEQFKSMELSFGSRVLCLGARFGEEVEALRFLGVPAIGLDIDPFLPYVVPGDMNDLSKYNHVQTIYTNATDHCWDVKAFIQGITKALKNDGHLIIHHGFGIGEFETWSPDNVEEFKTFLGDYDIVKEYAIMPKQYNLSYCFVCKKKSEVLI
jgi:hypothetical protein